MEAKKLLASYVDALYPIIYINHFDFNVIDDLSQEHCRPAQNY